MRRLMNYRDFVNNTDVTIESMNDDVTIGDYAVKRIGNLIFVEATVVIDAELNAGTNLFKVSGVPTAMHDLQTFGANGADTMYGVFKLVNTTEGIKFVNPDVLSSDDYTINLAYMVGGNEK